MIGKKYQGMTLIELLVAITILTVVMTGLSAIFSHVWKSNAYAIKMGQASFSVSRGLDRMVVYLRKARQADNGAYAIQSAAENDLVIFSDYDKNGATERLHFYLEGGQIKMGVARPLGGTVKTYPVEDQEVSVLAENIVNVESEPIFHYYNINYPVVSTNNPVPYPVDVSNVKLLKIFLKTNIDPSRTAENVEMESFVELRNLNDYNKVGL